MLINEDLTIFLIQIAVMLLVSLIFGQIVNKIGYPTVVGELLGGIILGPTILKHISPGLFHDLFPKNVAISTELYCFIQFGMILFMFTSGLKINYKQIMDIKKPVLFASSLGMIIPLLLGTTIVLSWTSVLKAPPGENILIYALFIGIALSISALPVIIKTLTDLNMAETDVGTIIIGSATINDLTGWTIFACLINVFMNASTVSIGISLVQLLLFVFILIVFGEKIVKTIFYFLERYVHNAAVYIGVSIILLAVLSAIAEKIGVHPFFAAFLLGILLKKEFESNVSLCETKKILSFLTAGIFAPIYFVSIGMKVNLIEDFNLKLVVIILVAACIGKITGSTIGAIIGGVKVKKAFTVGIGMNSRGAIEIIVASTAVEINMIGQEMYVALIVMAIVTSILSGPIIKKLSIDSGVTQGITMK